MNPNKNPDLEQIQFFYNKKTKKVVFYNLDFTKLSRGYTPNQILDLNNCWLETDSTFTKRQAKREKHNLKLIADKEKRTVEWHKELDELTKKMKKNTLADNVRSFVKTIFNLKS